MIPDIYPKPKHFTLPMKNLLLVSALIALSGGRLAAQVNPPLMNYQGQLLGPGGTNLPNADYALTFRIYNAAAGGTLIWGPQVFDGMGGAGHGPTVPIVQGLFNVVLGDVDISGRSLLSAFTNNAPDAAERYVEIQISTNAPIAPRQRILTAPFAINAATVTDGAVSTSKLTEGAVTSAKITDGAVTDAKLAEGAVSSAKIMDNAVTSAKISDASVTSVDIAPRAIADQHMNLQRLGIANDSPGTILHVGSPTKRGIVTIESSTGSSGYPGLHLRDSAFGGHLWELYSGHPNLGDFVIRDGTMQLTRLIIHGSTGNVGIGGRQATVNKLELAGEASKTVAGSWLANSDARIKTQVETIQDALDKLDQVRLVRFSYTDEYRASHKELIDRRYLNVIAQEFAKVFPDAVSGSGERLSDGHEILQVDIHPLTIYSAAAVQELHQMVKNQQVQLDAKDREIEALSERLAALEAMVRSLANGRPTRSR